MEDIVAEEVIPSGPAEGAQLQRKDNEYSLNPGNSNGLEGQEMRIPVEGEYAMRILDEGNCSPSSRQEILEMFDSRREDMTMSRVNELEHPYNSLGFMGDAGFMAEELPVRHHNDSNLPVVDTLNNQGIMQTRQNPWQHLYQLAGGSGSGSSRANTAFRDNGQVTSSGLENAGSMSFSDFLTHRAYGNGRYEVVEELTNTENRGGSGNTQAGIRTKVLSKSGFSEFIVKNTLKGKGVIFKGPHHESCHVESRKPNSTKVVGGSMETTDPTPSLDAHIVRSSSNGLNSGPRQIKSDLNDISLREWLKIQCPKANKNDCLYIYRQIVDLVDQFHSQAVALHELRPSFFKLSPSNEVKYVGIPYQKEMLESKMDQDVSHSENSSTPKNTVEQEFFVGLSTKKQKISQNTKLHWPQFSTTSHFKCETVNPSRMNITGLQSRSDAFDEYNLGRKHGIHTKVTSPHMCNAAQQLTSISEQLEEKWYASPEELSGGTCTVLSNIYNLGVLLFELLAHFDSNSTLAAAMSNLRHRILPSNFLSENAKEAGFCLWLLHPEPSSRPTTRDILQSEVVSGLQEVCVEELSSYVAQEDAELELLLHFLTSLKDQKQKDATKLVETIRFLEADVEEVEKRHISRKPLIDCGLYTESLSRRENTFGSKEHSRLDVLSPVSPVPRSNELRLMKNIHQLESVYFLMRSRIQLPDADSTTRQDKDLLRNRKNSYVATNDEGEGAATDRLGAIFDGLCRYARYTKFEVRGVMRNGDFNSSSNVVCSLSFDRDEDYFAAAGISKKIKIFEFNAFFNDSVDIHYPALEMVNKSKISCVCWNHYIKNYLASTDYDGVVKLWDASTGQEFAQYTEHLRRAWSVDFSRVYPTKLASGSDDGSVKLWSINEKNCLGTIKNFANVCCVQFSPHSTHLLALGSANFKTYCYDLRNTRIPWCELAGHEKAVSYVKFLDAETLVSASTDNTLKIWDLKKSTLIGPSIDACSLTLGGHTNEKNFVGLSISDGYIACGSETNEVYAYYKSLPMPITSHKFGSIDPTSGKETDDDKEPFVSSVCWRGKSEMVVAANSSGCLKVLQLV